MKEPIGVLVMAYGTPRSFAEIEAYYTHIRRGRRPSEGELRDLERRYRAIGGTFPLRENTERQVRALTDVLEARRPGAMVVRLGLKHAPPFIEDGVEALRAAGVRRVVGLVLAPHYSALSVGEYFARAQKAADAAGLAARFIERYGDDPALIALLRDRVVEALRAFPPASKVKVVFSAHSLPARIRAMNDPYEAELLATSRLVAAAAGVADWTFAFQSAGQTPEPWLGPDIREVLPALRAEGYGGVLVAPIGFVTEHLEICYDLDIEARAEGERLGLDVRRIRMPDDDPRFIGLLADRIEAVLGAWEA
ncbi:ferrochelatase [Hydrogenibacillus schlegelii]|uniref:Coproporphyrin III ferrochelatase n=2 Tax=Hydrogenibacillus schlegelii TaxID=1484 RepID=A0A132N9D7_HYDSH|nr:ferrochelatase [Hydrogenibacillus schlegelii]KWX06577.1 ferrochelatase [Hydrogenibacillus schlegelii]OAR04175.1 ferrochelatase [Hydrogenibacillus schlegelii]